MAKITYTYTTVEGQDAGRSGVESYTHAVLRNDPGCGDASEVVISLSKSFDGASKTARAYATRPSTEWKGMRVVEVNKH